MGTGGEEGGIYAAGRWWRRTPADAKVASGDSACTAGGRLKKAASPLGDSDWPAARFVASLLSSLHSSLARGHSARARAVCPAPRPRARTGQGQQGQRAGRAASVFVPAVQAGGVIVCACGLQGRRRDAMAHGPSSSSPFSLLAVACRFPNAGLGCCRFTLCAFMDGFAFATLVTAFGKLELEAGVGVV